MDKARAGKDYEWLLGNFGQSGIGFAKSMLCWRELKEAIVGGVRKYYLTMGRKWPVKSRSIHSCCEM